MRRCSCSKHGSHFFHPIKFPDFSLIFPWFPKIFPWFFLSFQKNILVKKYKFILFKCGLCLQLVWHLQKHQFITYTEIPSNIATPKAMYFYLSTHCWKISLIWNFFPWFWLKNTCFPWFPWLEKVFKNFPVFPDFPDRWEPCEKQRLMQISIGLWTQNGN